MIIIHKESDNLHPKALYFISDKNSYGEILANLMKFAVQHEKDIFWGEKPRFKDENAFCEKVLGFSYDILKDTPDAVLRKIRIKDGHYVSNVAAFTAWMNNQMADNNKFNEGVDEHRKRIEWAIENKCGKTLRGFIPTYNKLNDIGYGGLMTCRVYSKINIINPNGVDLEPDDCDTYFHHKEALSSE